MAVSVLPFELQYLITGCYEFGLFVCWLKETMFFFSLPSSIVNLFLLTFERLIKILLPYHYEEFFSTRRVTSILVISWSYTALVALFPFILDSNSTQVSHGMCFVSFPLEYSIYQVFGNFLIPLVCIVGMNIKIFVIAQKHFKEIQLQTQHLSVPAATGKGTKHFTANFKAAKTIMMLVGVFLFCWFTYIMMVTINIVCEMCVQRELLWTGNAINYSCVALNPLLYGLRNSDVRKVLVRKYAKWFCREKHAKYKKGKCEVRTPDATPSNSLSLMVSSENHS